MLLCFHMFHVPVSPAVLKSIVRGAIRKEKGSKDGGEQGAQPQGESAAMFEARMEAYQESLVKAMAKSNGKVEVAQIDMEQELKDKQVSLFDLFPTTQWAAGAAVPTCLQDVSYYSRGPCSDACF